MGKDKAKRQVVQAEQLLSDVGRLLEILKQADPFPCALIGTAFVEKALIALLHKFFIAGSTSAEQIFHEGKALGAFFNCAQAAYCLGLISKPTFQNLTLLANIRNELAHTHLPKTFDNPEIAELCKNLRPTDFGRCPIPFDERLSKTIAKHWDTLSPHSRFNFACVSMFQVIMFAASTVTSRPEYTD